jgi:hypothetical protein
MHQSRFSKAGKKGGAATRAKFVAAYNANPNICLHCEKPIVLREGQRPSAARAKKYCSPECWYAVSGGKYHAKFALKAGDKFNRLTVRREVYKSSQRLYVYECECECGESTTTRGDFLKAGIVKSCGCLVKEVAARNGRNSRLPDGVASRNKLIRSYKRGAKHRNLTFQLTPTEMDTLFKAPCHYCGSDPAQVAFNSNIHNPAGSAFVYNGIDRVDNSLGYVSDNVCTCCYICNRMKHTLGIKEFEQAVAKIARHLRLLTE